MADEIPIDDRFRDALQELVNTGDDEPDSTAIDTAAAELARQVAYWRASSAFWQGQCKALIASRIDLMEVIARLTDAK